MKNKEVILFRIAYTFIAILFFSLTSCSNDDEPTCNCEKAKYMSFVTQSYYFVEDVKINCETGQAINPNSIKDAVFVRCEDDKK